MRKFIYTCDYLGKGKLEGRDSRKSLLEVVSNNPKELLRYKGIFRYLGCFGFYMSIALFFIAAVFLTYGITNLTFDVVVISCAASFVLFIVAFSLYCVVDSRISRMKNEEGVA